MLECLGFLLAWEIPIKVKYVWGASSPVATFMAESAAIETPLSRWGQRWQCCMALLYCSLLKNYVLLDGMSLLQWEFVCVHKQLVSIPISLAKVFSDYGMIFFFFSLTTDHFFFRLVVDLWCEMFFSWGYAWVLSRCVCGELSVWSSPYLDFMITLSRECVLFLFARLLFAQTRFPRLSF